MNAAWIAVGVALTAGAVVLLVGRSRRGDPACRWLALTAALWGIAFAGQGASAGSIMPTGIQLTPSDLVALLGLPVLVVGMTRFGPPGSPPGPGSGLGSSLTSRIADGVLLALAVFAVGWITLLRSAYAATDVGPGSFTVGLIHPVADIAVLGGTLWIAVRAGSRGAAAYLALAAATLGDLLGVQARAGGMHPGSWSQLAWLLAICLLGASALPAVAESGRLAAPGLRTGSESSLDTVLATVAAGVASLVTFIYVLVNWGHPGPVPLLILGLLALALVTRVAVLLRHTSATTALALRSGNQFLQLAERTSDAVLLCDVTGQVRYASQAVAHYGYAPEELAGQSLPDLVHPDDLASLLRTAAEILRDEPVPRGSQACRVRAADGTWRHVEVVMSRYIAADSGAEQDLVLVTARDVSDQVALRRQVTHLTFHDGLTGLPNRSYLEERAKDLLAREPANGTSGQTGAIIVDLDGFTAVNDSAGHGAGDVLLAQAGRLLRGVVPAHDTVARWGGDEFAVLVEDAASPQEIVDLAERIAGAVAAEPFSVANRDISVTASVGVAFTDSATRPAGAASDAEDAADAEVPEHLLRNADLAMSRAKDSGGGRVEVFAAHMYDDVTRRMELATGLRTAIAEGSLGVEYQPVTELASSRAVDVEALVRWPRTGEPVDSAELLSIAEDSGLSVPLGDWLLREACRQVALWRAAGWQAGLGVNLTLRKVSSAGLVESVLATLADAGLPPSALTLELTERVLIECTASAIDALTQLRAMGVRVAIDDFGSGYASLAYLRQLPVDIIKIAPSFVAGLRTDAILEMLTRTIVQVGHDLGIEVVAVGIERPDQLELLCAMGCRLGQGPLVAQPMNADAFEPSALARGLGSAGRTSGNGEAAGQDDTAVPIGAGPEDQTTAPGCSVTPRG